MNPISLDYLSIAIAAVLYVVVHQIWFSRWLFSKDWAKLTNANPFLTKRRSPYIGIFFDLCLGFVYAFFLSFFVAHLNVASVTDGIFVAFCCWLGFAAPTDLSPIFWSKKPLRLFFIQTGARLLSLLAMGGIIGA